MLFAKPKSLHQRVVSVEIFALEVLEELAALTGHRNESATRMEILGMILQVSGQLRDTFGEKCNLHLARSGIGSVGLVLFDSLCFFHFYNHDWKRRPF